MSIFDYFYKTKERRQEEERKKVEQEAEKKRQEEERKKAAQEAEGKRQEERKRAKQEAEEKRQEEERKKAEQEAEEKRQEEERKRAEQEAEEKRQEEERKKVEQEAEEKRQKEERKKAEQEEKEIRQIEKRKKEKLYRIELEIKKIKSRYFEDMKKREDKLREYIGEMENENAIDFYNVFSNKDRNIIDYEMEHREINDLFISCLSQKLSLRKRIKKLEAEEILYNRNLDMPIRPNFMDLVKKANDIEKKSMDFIIKFFLADIEVEEKEYSQLIEELNKKILQLKNKYLLELEKNYEKYIEHSLLSSTYPKSIKLDYVCKFDKNYIITNIILPNMSDLPRQIGEKYFKTYNEFRPIVLNEKMHEKFYDITIKRIVLRVIKEIIDIDITAKIEHITINGYINSIDRGTGKEYSACIISVSTEIEKFKSFNLSQVDPYECIRELKGVYVGSLSKITPVKPIAEINTEDRRFIIARDIAESLEDGSNLATMPWEDFEHLVRELFGKIFSGENSEVKVTQSSRDGGVDAIAFDTDPIKGGKFVIQAKRYNNVVPVSAARDLYGTMINEGASKGILVTTSYFGRDTREFVKDKPISLIDGHNLIFYMEKFGYKAHIKLNKGKNNSDG